MPPKEEKELTPEELEAQEAEPLPDREVLTTIDGMPIGRIPYDELGQPASGQPISDGSA